MPLQRAKGIFSHGSLEHALAGSCGSMLATFLLYPLDRWKTLLQVAEPSQRREHSATASPRRKSHSIEVLIAMFQNDGFFGVWGGCLPMLQTVGISSFIYFFLFEGLKTMLLSTRRRRGREGYSSQVVLLASTLAAAVNVVLTEPLWRASVVLQSVGGGEKSVLAAAINMGKAEGFHVLWDSLGTSLWLVCNPVVQFFTYDLLKEANARWSLRADVSGKEAFVLGAIAKAVATVVSFPLIVAQARLRAASGGPGSRRPSLSVPCPSPVVKSPEPLRLECSNGTLQGEAQKFAVTAPSLISCLRELFRERGFRGLFLGLGPKLSQTVLTAAFMFMFYEKIYFVIRRASRLYGAVRT